MMEYFLSLWPLALFVLFVIFILVFVPRPQVRETNDNGFGCYKPSNPPKFGGSGKVPKPSNK